MNVLWLMVWNVQGLKHLFGYAAYLAAGADRQLFRSNAAHDP